ncbi:MAG: DUF2203 domain-containing protein [Verrucomicrobia bacterium]|nr:DUF2203 domain-containing protein [Verrucomicrobiota bacterium]
MPEAIGLLPRLRVWLEELSELRASELKIEVELSKLLSNADDIGGEVVNQSLRNLSRMKEILSEFHRREIQLKDLDRGLLDFPSLFEGREVFLCWEKDEPSITHWHDLEAGYRRTTTALRE